MKLDNFLRSGYFFSSEESELETEYMMTMFSALFSAVFLMALSLFFYFNGDTVSTVIYMIGFFLVIFAIYLHRIVGKENYHIVIYLMVGLFFLLIMFAYYVLPEIQPVSAWIIVQILVSFLILNIALAIWVTVAFSVSVVYMNHILEYHSIEYIILHIVPAIIALFFVYIINKKFQKNILSLEESNIHLEERVNKRTQAIQLEKERLAYQSNHDFLTSLPNRSKFENEIQVIIDNGKNINNNLAILFIDLDHFKNINDSFGHHIGDNVLKITADRIRQCICKEDCFARFGGDEFIVLINQYDSRKNLGKIAENIISFVSRVVLIENMTMFVSCSIGISIYNDKINSYHDFIKYADTAMYKAKERGRNSYQFYTSDMTKVAFERVLMETSMRFALEKEEFIIHYQPQIDGRSNKIVGMEALVRWSHETMGLLPPITFIPLAEEIGLIVLLDQWVMKAGMIQIKEWYDAGLSPGRLSLNLSVKQLQEKSFIDVVKNMLNETACKAEWIEFEITESHIMYNVIESIVILNNIKSLGIKIAIDDFGTGYSSLSYLKKLPVDKLKIDSSFIIGIPNNKEDIAITHAIIDIAKNLNLEVIAEGVETKQQQEYLIQAGCHLIQGYIDYKPMLAKEIEIILKGLD